MLITFAAAAAANGAAAHGGNPYGLIPALQQGGPLTIAVFVILVIMSVGSFYVLFAKLFEQNRIMQQAKKVRGSFWTTSSLRDGSNKLEKDSAYRQLVDDGLRAEEQHTLLSNEVDQHDWTLNALARSRGSIGAKLNRGLSFLATTGSTAPFIGLFGTVIGILGALVKIGAAGQASIDAVAGPVGEALIMTAIGLAVAVPAVLAFNWLQARNKAIMEELTTFSNDIHGYMASNGSVKPVMVGASGRPATVTTAARSTTTTAGQVGGVQTPKA